MKVCLQYCDSIILSVYDIFAKVNYQQVMLVFDLMHFWMHLFINNYTSMFDILAMFLIQRKLLSIKNDNKNTQPNLICEQYLYKSLLLIFLFINC